VRLKSLLFWYLILSMFVVSAAPPLEASFSGSRALPGSTDEREADMGRIQRLIETKVVEARLQELGFSATEIETRLASLDDAEIHQIASQLEDLKTGGAAEGLIIGILVIILVIGVILPLLGIRVWR